jgi:hypothetical protein
MTIQADTAVQGPAIPLAKSVFFDLFHGHASQEQLDGAVDFLNGQLNEAALLPSDLPSDMNGLYDWMQTNVDSVGHQYLEYLELRKAGGARRYFSTKSHALYFLRSVAPSKLVDGAWLYGLLPRWQDPRFLSLIQTYLEELGEGQNGLNHVVLYRKLLATQGCERWDDLTEEHYVQGAIQLTLAYQAEHFLPEVIGFNLGYEQLPLHLLITAYELKELGIDPFYFTLHVTVDNADSGHARKAVDAIFDAMPHLGSSEEFYQRVQNGYMLNMLGAGTNSVIDSFDLERELLAIFQRKGAVGQYAHSDYRQVADKTVNEWLSEPEKTQEFLAEMEQAGWFKRNQDPKNSRFWKLIESDRGKMFGVFNVYERQVIYDWIAGDAVYNIPSVAKAKLDASLPPKAIDGLEDHSQIKGADRATRIVDHPELLGLEGELPNDFDTEVQTLKSNLATATNQKDAVDMLIALMSPAHHHAPAGLMATRIFNDMLQ